MSLLISFVGAKAVLGARLRFLENPLSNLPCLGQSQTIKRSSNFTQGRAVGSVGIVLPCQHHESVFMIQEMVCPANMKVMMLASPFHLRCSAFSTNATLARDLPTLLPPLLCFSNHVLAIKLDIKRGAAGLFRHFCHDQAAI